MAGDLEAKAERLAAKVVRAAFEELPVVPVPLSEPQSGFVDVVFDVEVDQSDGSRTLTFLMLADVHGHATEIGHWLEEDDSVRLRLPWAPGGVAQPKPTRAPALMVMPLSGSDGAKVLGQLIKNWREGGVGLTDEELRSRAGINEKNVAPRRVGLTEGGWVQNSGFTITNAKGRALIQWTLTPAALTKLNMRSTP